jgi:PAS domain S-box-containing protein
MATKEFKSPRYKMPVVGQFLESYITFFSGMGSAASGLAKKYFIRFSELMSRYEEIVLDSRGSILSWNNKFALMEGYAGEEVIGQNFNLLVPPQLRQGLTLESLLERASKIGQATYRGQLVRKDGALFEGSLRIERVRCKGKVLGFIAACRKSTSGIFPSPVHNAKVIDSPMVSDSSDNQPSA